MSGPEHRHDLQRGYDPLRRAYICSCGASAVSDADAMSIAPWESHRDAVDRMTGGSVSANNQPPKKSFTFDGIRVPLVGDRQAIIRQALISVIATCACGSNVPIVLANIAARAKCQDCGDEYFVSSLDASFDGRESGGLDIKLGCFTAAPKSLS